MSEPRHYIVKPWDSRDVDHVSVVVATPPAHNPKLRFTLAWDDAVEVARGLNPEWEFDDVISQLADAGWDINTIRIDGIVEY